MKARSIHSLSDTSTSSLNAGYLVLYSFSSGLWLGWLLLDFSLRTLGRRVCREE